MELKETLMSRILLKNPPKKLSNPSDRLVTDDLVGVEVELEGVSGQGVMDVRGLVEGWGVKEDDSLRGNGYEFVTRPLHGEALITALEKFNKVFKTRRYKLSPRCSVHVHINVLDLTFQEYINFNILSHIFEKALLRYCGSTRQNNIFCLSADEAQISVKTLAELSQSTSSEEICMYLAGIPRYAAINRQATSKFGTLEFRSLEGTTSAQRIIRWINMLLSIKKYIKGNKGIDFNILPKSVSQMGYKEFVVEVFKDYAPLLDSPNLEMDILSGVRLSQDIIYAANFNNAANLAEVNLSEDGGIICNHEKVFGREQKKKSIYNLDKGADDEVHDPAGDGIW